MKSIATVFLVVTTLASVAYADPVGLGIYVSNGTYSKGLDGSVAPSQLRILDDGRPRYLSEFDVASKVPTTEVTGITPLKTTGPFGQLDWTGVHQVPCHPDGTMDDWRLEIDDTTWMHSTCYKGAAWMERSAALAAQPRDANGHNVGQALVGIAGSDDDFVSVDSWWERRFVARVVSHNCAAVGDCSTASATYAEALIQVRGNLNPNLYATTISPNASSLTLTVFTCSGSVQLAQVPIYHDSPNATPYGYGFKTSLVRVTPYPAAGFFSPGDSVSFQVTYTDGAGHRFFAPGTLPSYGAGALFDLPSAAGVRYLTYVDDPVLYWAHKNTQSDMAFTVAGPIDRMNSVGTTPITISEAGSSQIPEATPAADGYSAFVQIFPPTSLVFPCLFSGGTAPECNTPVGDTFTVTVPADALPGTWTAQIKARRVWEGEPVQAAASTRFQVGQATTTSYSPKMSGCLDCHSGRTSLAVVGHGFDVGNHEKPECLSCHTKGYDAWFENDAGFDKRMSFVHLLSSHFFSMGGTAAEVTFP